MLTLTDAKLLCDNCVGCELVADGQGHCLVREAQLEMEDDEELY